MLDRLGNILCRVIIPTSSIGTHNLDVREAWLKTALASIPNGHRILDAGAGELRYKPLCEHLDYVSQDFGQYDGQGNGTGLQIGQWDNSKLDIVSDIISIPEPDASFDAIMCIEVLEHVPAPVDALRELTRLLRSDGIMIITAPFCSMTHFAPYFFHTGYSRYFYEYWFGELGLTIEDMQWNGDYFEYLAQEIRRLPAIGEQYAGEGLSIVEHIGIRLILHSLERLVKKDNGSEQLMSFGLNVKARKFGK